MKKKKQKKERMNSIKIIKTIRNKIFIHLYILLVYMCIYYSEMTGHFILVGNMCLPKCICMRIYVNILYIYLTTI